MIRSTYKYSVRNVKNALISVRRRYPSCVIWSMVEMGMDNIIVHSCKNCPMCFSIDGAKSDGCCHGKVNVGALT